MKNKKIALFVIIIAITFLTGYLSANKGEVFTKNIDTINVLYIFIANWGILMMLIVVSFSGVSIFFIVYIIFQIGVACKESGMDIYIYLPISLIHGVFELAALYLIYSLTFKFFESYYQIIKSKTGNHLAKTLKKSVFFYIPTVTILLIIGSFLEVLISNEIIVNLY